MIQKKNPTDFDEGNIVCRPSMIEFLSTKNVSNKIDYKTLLLLANFMEKIQVFYLLRAEKPQTDIIYQTRVQKNSLRMDGRENTSWKVQDFSSWPTFFMIHLDKDIHLRSKLQEFVKSDYPCSDESCRIQFIGFCIDFVQWTFLMQCTVWPV